MPRIKEEHKNWINSHTDDILDVLRKGPHFAASFKGRDNIVVVIPALPDGSLIMGEVYRAALDEISLEFPSGYTKEDETLLEAATRIATTQAGKISEYPTFAGEVSPAPGILDLRVHLFIARVPLSVAETLKPSGDMITLRAISIQELTDTIAKGGAADATTIACLMKYLTRAKEGVGSLPTKMHTIEILDSKDQVLTSVLTNKPEWSFIEYSQGNSRAHEWRFKISAEEISVHTASKELCPQAPAPSQSKDDSQEAREAVDAGPEVSVSFRSANRPKSATTPAPSTPRRQGPRRLNLSVSPASTQPELHKETPAAETKPELLQEATAPAPRTDDHLTEAAEPLSPPVHADAAPQISKDEEATPARLGLSFSKPLRAPKKKPAKDKADTGGLPGFFKRTLARINHSVDSDAIPPEQEEVKPPAQKTIYAPHADIFDAPATEHGEDNGFHWPVRSKK